MQRRHLAFFAVSFAIIMLWQAFFPAKPLVDKKQQDVPVAQQELEADDPEADDPEAGKPEANAEEGPVLKAATDGQPDVAAQPGDQLGDQQPAEIVVPEVDSDPYYTLGSLTPGGPHRLLATFDSHGATLRRLELSSLLYRDLHDKAGYLGQLELMDVAKVDGAKVQVVGAGTPAAEAGIEAGDRIIAIRAKDNKRIPEGEVAVAADMAKRLKKSKPGDEIEITLLRDGKEQTVSATLIARPLDVIRPEQENVLLHRETLPEDFEQHPSLEVSLLSVGPQPVSKVVLAEANKQLATGLWGVESSTAGRIEFSMVLPKLGIEVIKRFEVPVVPKASQDDVTYRGYHLEFAVEIRNLRSEAQKVTYQLQGPNGLPIEGWWYANKVGRSWSGYGLRDVVLRTYGNSEQDFPCRKIATGDIKPYGDGQSLAYMGVDAQYFAAAILPKKESREEKHYSIFTPGLASTRVDEEKKSIQLRYNNSSFRLTSQSISLSAAGSKGDHETHGSTLFTGPKLPSLLAHYQAADSPEETLEDFVYYGWFGNLGIPQLMVGVLSFFYGIVGNYGIAIILLTVLARSCMFPLSRKQAKNMIKMQELKPEMDRITARYKDDPTARTEAQRTLWAKHNYNPMGGCLLMFFQFPIFIGLYRSLMVDVELRQASLIPGVDWCSNLAAPDMLMSWEGMWWRWFVNGEGMFALGPYFNILPLATVGLFLLQQKMFMPPPTDDQSEMMQKMMKYMMIFMSFMFFKVAAGLCLYFIASSIWGITERKLIPQPAKPASNVPAPAERELPTRKKPLPKQKSGGKGKGKSKGKGNRKR